jgi:hypothetical protein
MEGVVDQRGVSPAVGEALHPQVPMLMQYGRHPPVLGSLGGTADCHCSLTVFTHLGG